MKVFLLLSMLMCHVIADWVIQGELAREKQQRWWMKNYPDILYKNDWIAALITHSFAWSFMMLLPMFVYALYYKHPLCIPVLIINTIIHFEVDHLKANKFKINLVVDQAAHVLQIVLSWAFYVSYYKI